MAQQSHVWGHDSTQLVLLSIGCGRSRRKAPSSSSQTSWTSSTHGTHGYQTTVVVSVVLVNQKY